jgi:hypothetical protein
MSRFYHTPYGKQLIHKKSNSGAQIIVPGMTTVVPLEEKKERQKQTLRKVSTKEKVCRHARSW